MNSVTQICRMQGDKSLTNSLYGCECLQTTHYNLSSYVLLIHTFYYWVKNTIDQNRFYIFMSAEMKKKVYKYINIRPTKLNICRPK